MRAGRCREKTHLLYLYPLVFIAHSGDISAIETSSISHKVAPAFGAMLLDIYFIMICSFRLVDCFAGLEHHGMYLSGDSIKPGHHMYVGFLMDRRFCSVSGFPPIDTKAELLRR